MINDYTRIETKSVLLWLDKFLEDNNVDNKIRCNLHINLNKALSKHHYFTFESIKYIKKRLLEHNITV